jgi:hypothetical protein
MFAFNVAKWLVLVALVVTNTIQIFAYFRVKKVFARLPVVAAEITQRKMFNDYDIDGRRRYEADIRFRYRYQGKEYESQTAALRSAQLFPLWNYERELYERYPIGSVVNARVLPDVPEVAFLEVAPFSVVSAVLLPIATVVYALGIVFYGWFIWGLTKQLFGS